MCTETEWRAWMLFVAQPLTRCAADAEDIVQEVLLQFWEVFGVLPWEYHPHQWARTVCRRWLRLRTIDWNRRAPTQRNITLENWDAPLPEGHEGSETRLIEHAEMQLLRQRLEEQLSPQQQEMLHLYLEGYTYQEIARRLNVSVGTVKCQFCRMRQKAQTMLSTFWGAESELIGGGADVDDQPVFPLDESAGGGGSSKYLLVIILLGFVAFGYAGVIARIKPQSIVVCPGKRVTWECIAQASCDCPQPQMMQMRQPIDLPGIDDSGKGEGGNIPPPSQPGDPPPEEPNDPPYPYPCPPQIPYPCPPRPPAPPGDPGKPWPPGYPPGDPEPGCENPPAVSRLTYTWKIERQEAGRWVIERGPEEGGARWPEGGFLFTEAHAGKRFRISCTVKAYGRLPDGTEILCGQTTAYAFARVRRQNELAVSLEAEPEPAGVWQTITMTATVDLECGGTPPFTYRWRFGDDPNKVVERSGRGESDTVHYFYQRLYRYLVRVEVEDSEGRRGSASMWVHVGLAVRLGSPMSMAVPLRDYIQEGEEAGLADPNWTPEQINYESYLAASAPHKAHIVSVAAPGQKLPFEYEHHKRRSLYLITYPRVDPLWGTKEILPVLRQAGVSITMGTVEVADRQSGWRNDWGWQGIWWVPDNTYLWPLNARVRNTDTKAYWWNYWTNSPLEFQANTLHKLLTTAKLGWMESWDIAAITTLAISVEIRSGGEDHARSGLIWSMRDNPCTNQRVPLLWGGAMDAPARLVAAEVRVDHPWRLSQDPYQTQVVASHRQRAQVGIVQSVEQFTKGYFDYGTGGQLWYYLAYEPQFQGWFRVREQTDWEPIVQALDQETIHPTLYQAFQRNGYTLSGAARVRVVSRGQEWNIFDGQNIFRLKLEPEGAGQALQVYRVLVGDRDAEPPLLDTICCPQDRITHAWYAKTRWSRRHWAYYQYGGQRYLVSVITRYRLTGCYRLGITILLPL
ncbi:MAG: hypothetical protein KatS3mg016_1119 [Fimbriimonadales bacterium]|nr:MAG: hypothetical protein KatS3mg016_1119 [Fimbriimonadales bacterium]